MGGRRLEPDSGFYSSIYDTPFLDRYLAELAIEIVDAEQLGADGSVDLLGLSFSALDTVGHDYGPNSREVVDVLLRLDRVLDELLSHLDAAVGSEHVLVALSADHGVATMPEYILQAGDAAARVDAEHVRCVQRAGLRLEETFGAGEWALRGFYLNDATILEKGLEPAAVQQALAAQLTQCDGVARVWTRAEILAEWPADDPALERVRNSYNPDRSPDVLVQHEPWYLAQSGWGTTHGSLYPHDSAVPLIIAGPGIAASRIAERTRTVDLAPTLVSLVGIPVPEELDGMDKSALLRW